MIRTRPRKGARKIVVHGSTYWWYKGHSNIVIWSPTGSCHSIPDHIVAGMTSNDAERAKWKKYFSITPDDIRRQIEGSGI